jgi:hypothetical protein
MQIDTSYLCVILALPVLAILLILAISRRNVLMFAPVIMTPTAWSAMIQWRHKIDLPRAYSSGHVLAEGVSWHFWAALTILCISFASLALWFSWRQQTGLLQALGNLLFASRTLAGIWAYVVWAELPVHPPTCNVPVVCHDVELWGFGGGLWWAGPFLAAAALNIARSLLIARERRARPAAEQTSRLYLNAKRPQRRKAPLYADGLSAVKSCETDSSPPEDVARLAILPNGESRTKWT